MTGDGALEGSAFAAALEAARGRYNAEFVQARHHRPQLDRSAFEAHLRDTVGPVVEAVARAAPAERVREVLDVLFEFSLDLVGKGLFDRYPAILNGWRRLLPAQAGCLAAEPRLYAGSVTNALHHLSSTPGARPAEWLEGLLDLGEVCPDVRQLLEAGKVLAWRSGMAHFRQSALAVCRALPPSAVLAALGLKEVEEDRVPGIVDRLKADPWLTPHNAVTPGPLRLCLVARAGAFRGFGGAFMRPPTVFSVQDDLYVTDGEDCWSIWADAFGSVLQRVGDPPAAQPGRSRYTLMQGGNVHAEGGDQGHFAQLATITSVAGTTHTLAATVPQSHSVYLVALT